MLLQPRKFRYKNKQKLRTRTSWKQKTLTFGNLGLRLLKTVRITTKKLFRIKLYLKKATRKSEFTKRRIWFHSFPHLPLTKKTKGLRMGKGSGKLSTWFLKIYGGSFFIEFKNVRYGRALFFFRQISYKLHTKTFLEVPSRVYFNIPHTRKVGVISQPFF